MNDPRRDRWARGAILLLACGLFLALVASSCATARRGAPLAAPLDLTSDAAREGRLVFARNCFACHGHGEGGLGPAINDKPLPAFLIKTQVRKGLGAMPAFDQGEIPDADLQDLIAYLAELRHGDAP